jgi:hypothetical protein
MPAVVNLYELIQIRERKEESNDFLFSSPGRAASASQIKYRPRGSGRGLAMAGNAPPPEFKGASLPATDVRG